MICHHLLYVLIKMWNMKLDLKNTFYGYPLRKQNLKHLQ